MLKKKKKLNFFHLVFFAPKTPKSASEEELFSGSLGLVQRPPVYRTSQGVYSQKGKTVFVAVTVSLT